MRNWNNSFLFPASPRNAANSKILTSYDSLCGGKFCVILLLKHSIRSDLVERKLRNPDNDGGIKTTEQEAVANVAAVSFRVAVHTCLALSDEFLEFLWIAAVLLSMTGDTYFLFCLAQISSIVRPVHITDRIHLR